MNCINLIDYMTINDFDCIADIAKHCDMDTLCIATEESKNFDIIPLFCFDFIDDVLKNWNLNNEDEKYDKYHKLICGCSYEINGRIYQNFGLKKVWIYYSYARYLLINQFKDTANGTVHKKNEWSIPTPLKEITVFSNKYRGMGKEAYKSVFDYLCVYKDDFPKFDDCNCKKLCGCIGYCTCGKTKKLTGFKFSTLIK